MNDILHYSRSSRETGIKKGEYTRVLEVDAQKNFLTVARHDGSEQTYDPRRQMGVTVYREQEKSFAVGDRVQLTAPNNDLEVANREIGTIQNFDANGGLRLKLESGREAVIDPQKFPHLDHGYAVTSYSGQGQTADRVLVHVDTELARTGLLNSRMAYVAISRGQWDAQIFTNDRLALANVLARDVSHQSAIQPQINVAAPAQEIAHIVRADVSQGLGLGL